MSKEVILGMMDVAENGNELLIILKGISNPDEEVISSAAVDFSGNPVNF